MNTCSKPACDQPVRGRGLCLKHYKHRLYVEQKSKHSAKARAYRLEHKAEIKASQKAWADAHKEHIRAKGFVYREQNHEMLREKKRKYYEDNREKLKARIRQQAMRTFPDSLREALYFHQKGLCAICGVELTLGAKCKTQAQRDHDHKTHAPRGLLCICCNTCLGHYERSQHPMGLVLAPYDAYLANPPAFSL